MRKVVSSFLIALFALFAAMPGAYAWGPHPPITAAALAVLPERDRWNAILGAENIDAFVSYCWMPDNRGQDLGSFYADDYLLIRAVPRHTGHTMPDVQQAWVPYFRRALQALRTETPANACRQIGPILHWVEDTGAPPHAKAKCPRHSEMENWIKGEQIGIPGYKPRLLGNNDEEAVAGLEKRLNDLVAFSIIRADRALPLVQAATPDRAAVEPILLESANECARAAADLLYTLFTVGLAPQPDGATLEGSVTGGLIPERNDHGARIVLLDSDYNTLAVTSKAPTTGAGWTGEYRLGHLPAGTYRVLAYRTGSGFVVGGPVVLESGKTTRLDFTLPPTEPGCNLVENPDGRLSYLVDGTPDRWRRDARPKGALWTSASVRTAAGTTYRCGAALRDPNAKVRFIFQPAQRSTAQAVSVDLPAGQSEARQEADAQHPTAVVTVESEKPLAEAVERVWVVPEPKGP